MNSELNQKETVQSMRRKTCKLEREGDYWTEEDKELLYTLFESGVGITEIAITLQRTEPAVIQQIEKMNLYNRGKYIPKKKHIGSYGCQCSSCPHGPRDSASCQTVSSRTGGLSCSMNTTTC